MKAEDPAECISAGVLLGLQRPTDCPAFVCSCSPENPMGVPMVATDVACASSDHHRRHSAEV